MRSLRNLRAWSAQAFRERAAELRAGELSVGGDNRDHPDPPYDEFRSFRLAWADLLEAIAHSITGRRS